MCILAPVIHTPNRGSFMKLVVSVALSLAVLAGCATAPGGEHAANYRYVIMPMRI